MDQTPISTHPNMFCPRCLHPMRVSQKYVMEKLMMKGETPEFREQVEETWHCERCDPLVSV